MHERHTLALELNRVADGAVDQAHAAAVADGLDTDADLDVAWEIREADRLPEFFRFGLRAETNLLELFRKFLRQEIESLLRLRRASGVFDARIDVFRVFTEDDHVHLLRMLHRRRHAREPLHRAEADIQIEHLPQRHVQRTNAAADRRGQRSFDANEIFAERFDRVIRQPVIEFVLGRFPGEHFKPGDLALAAVGLLHRGIHHLHARGPDVGPCAVTSNERDDWIFRHIELAVLDRNFSAGGRGNIFIGHVRSLVSIFSD